MGGGVGAEYKPKHPAVGPLTPTLSLKGRGSRERYFHPVIGHVIPATPGVGGHTVSYPVPRNCVRYVAPSTFCPLASNFTPSYPVTILLCGRSVAASAACSFAGSVDPARFSASASTNIASMSRAEASSMSRPVLALNTSLMRADRLPGGPRFHALRLITPCEIVPTAGMNAGSAK